MVEMSSARIARLAHRVRKAKLYNAPRPVARRPLNLPADLFPTRVNGRWRKPRISARHRAAMRKEAMLSGTFGSYSPESGECCVRCMWGRSSRLHAACPLTRFPLLVCVCMCVWLHVSRRLAA